ncbi:MAG: hypothetical protein AAF633_02190 [Chloroflexota bacterium]
MINRILHLRRLATFLSLILLAIGGCTSQPEPIPVSEEPTVISVATVPPTETVSPTAEPRTSTPAPAEEEEEVTESLPTEEVPTATAEIQAEPIPLDALTFPAAREPLPTLIELVPSENQRRTALDLTRNLPVERNDFDIARDYFGITESIYETINTTGQTLPVGTIQQLNIKHFSLDTYNQINAELLGVSEHAYFWFDQTAGLPRPSDAEILAVNTAFDEIYDQVISFFGPEDRPGVDGDMRMHVINVSPITLCAADQTTTSVPACGLLGYHSRRDILPKSIDPFSNEREMFVMNGSTFGTQTYLSTLAHELRHLIEANYDTNDLDWEIEGSADLAVDLLNLGNFPRVRGEGFLNNPDQQLNRWSEQNRSPRYGQGYLLNRYIYDRLGREQYFEFATHPEPGLDAVDAIAEANQLSLSGESIWLDWLIASGIHTAPNVPDIYRLSGITIEARKERVGRRGSYDTTVNQYAADYYELPTGDSVSIDFSGTTLSPMVGVQPTSGENMWLARRTNNSLSSLTRSFDLTSVSSATLIYDVYRDIERGFDYGYVLASIDEGNRWVPLVGENMDGLVFEDNPGSEAFTERYYTSRGNSWATESIDLTPFTGHDILLRFDYVTDSILNYDGLAIDNIAIPEIGFVDAVESGDDNGWDVQGFVRSDGYIPQTWHIMLVQTGFDGVEVTEIELDEFGKGSLEFQPIDGPKPPLLIVAASAPVTLTPATYRLVIN